MIKLEQIYFGNSNHKSRTHFPLTMFEDLCLKYSATIVIEGILIDQQTWDIRGDDLRELYQETRRIARQFIKQPNIDVVVLMYSNQLPSDQYWYYYRPLTIYK